MGWDKLKPASSTKLRLSNPEILANFAAVEAAMNLAAGVLRIFPVGTDMVFYQDACPAGWAIQNTLNDKLLFVTKGSVAGGLAGGIAHATGSWTVSGLTKDAHGHAFTQPGAHTNHAFTQPGAHTNHAFTQPNNHTALALNNHTFTQPTAHGITQPTFTVPVHNHKWYSVNPGGVDYSYTVVSGQLYITAAGDSSTMGIAVGTSSTLNANYYTNNQGVANCTITQNVALTNNHSGGGVNAHSFSTNISAHAGGAVNAHSAHAGGAVNAHSAHAGGAVGVQSNNTVTHTPGWRPASYNIIIGKKT